MRLSVDQCKLNREWMRMGGGFKKSPNRLRKRQTGSGKGSGVCLIGCAPPSLDCFSSMVVLWLLHLHTLYCASVCHVCSFSFLHGMGMPYTYLCLSLAGSIVACSPCPSSLSVDDKLCIFVAAACKQDKRTRELKDV